MVKSCKCKQSHTPSSRLFRVEPSLLAVFSCISFPDTTSSSFDFSLMILGNFLASKIGKRTLKDSNMSYFSNVENCLEAEMSNDWLNSTLRKEGNSLMNIQLHASQVKGPMKILE